MVGIPNDRMVRLTLLDAADEDAPQAAGEPLLFKTTRERTSGFLLRWHAYEAGGADSPGGPQSRVLIDIVDPDTRVAYHRIEHRFANGVRFKLLDAAPLPGRNPTAMLYEPGSSAVLPLLAAEGVAPPGKTKPVQMHLLAEISHVRPGEVSAIPLFQMPPASGYQAPATTEPTVDVTRTFPLRHQLAGSVAEQLRQILQGRPGHDARQSANDQEIIVTASPDVMKRVQSFIAVVDWPDTLQDRYRRLGPGRFPDGTRQWLNWILQPLENDM